MGFKVPRSKKELPENRFEFGPDKGDEYSIPLLAFLPVDAASLFEQGMEINGILRACGDAGAREFVGSLDTDQFREFMREWNRLSEERQGITAGESSASSA